jgi:hypothetical protein
MFTVCTVYEDWSSISNHHLCRSQSPNFSPPRLITHPKLIGLKFHRLLELLPAPRNRNYNPCLSGRTSPVPVL